MTRATIPSPITVLKPLHNKWLRLTCLIPLWGLASIGNRPWAEKIGFILGTAMIFGTYRGFSISQKFLRHHWTVCFFDLPHKKWNLKHFSKLQTQYDSKSGVLEFLVVGPMSFVYGWVLDRLFSWIGGSYMIWLNNLADEPVLAWQGNSQKRFEESLATLQSRCPQFPLSMR